MLAAISCGCQDQLLMCGTIKKTIASKTKGNRLPSILVSIVLALFPKCPLCLAAYLTVFGSFGLSMMPYLKWLLPVLIGLLLMHLFLLFRKRKEQGYGPLVSSLVGSAVLLSGRLFFEFNKPMLFAGMGLLILGSLWNNFSQIFPKMKLLQPTGS